MIRIVLVATHLLTCSAASRLAETRSLPSAGDSFGADFSKVKWAHAVNSVGELEQALKGKVMMIEADVGMGTLVGNAAFTNGETVGPIMSHPLLGASDLSLERFLDTVLTDGNDKGIKLDFKNIDALEPALIMLTQRYAIRVPVWLNADILPGPVNAPAQPVDAGRFLGLVERFRLPGAVLSVGWTTRFGPELTNPLLNVKEGSYTMEHVRQMRDVLQNSTAGHAITFPVRAGLVTSDESRTNLLWLLEQVPGSSLTLWSSFYDTVDVAGLMKTLKAVGLERVFIDVPAGLHCQIRHFDDDL